MVYETKHDHIIRNGVKLCKHAASILEHDTIAAELKTIQEDAQSVQKEVEGLDIKDVAPTVVIDWTIALGPAAGNEMKKTG